MDEAKHTSDETGASDGKLGGLLLLFVAGCIAYIVLSPILVIAGISMDMMPYSHPAVIVLMTIMEVDIVILMVLIIRRDRRFVYAYLAGGVIGVAMAATQGIIGFTTTGITIATIGICIIGATLVLAYFLRSKRVRAYLSQ